MKPTKAVLEAIAKAESEGRTENTTPLKSSFDGGTFAISPWCAQCNSYHPRPQDKKHWKELKCSRPWKEWKGKKPKKKFNLPVERLAQIFGRYFGEPEREYKFHPDRRWKFDLAFPKVHLAVEYEGIFSAKSRHTTISGFDGDATKYSTAAILGWVVIRITAIMLKDGRAESLAELASKAMEMEN